MSKIRAKWIQSTLSVYGGWGRGAGEETDFPSFLFSKHLCQILGCLGIPGEQNLFPTLKELRDKEIGH